jgi:GTP-binding protein
VHRGTIKEGQQVAIVKQDGTVKKGKVKELYVFEGLGKVRAEEVRSGDIAAISGIENFEIGDTFTDVENPEAMAPISMEEPTMSMLFTINNSPFFGKEGKFVTSRHIHDRLHKELEKNLAMRVVPTDSPDAFLVFGRGVMHLSVLIETMRREGYELQVGQPRVITKEIDGKKCEPIEALTVDTPEEHAGKIIELVTARKGEMINMSPKGDITRLEFNIPSRGLIGLRNSILTSTAGEAIMAYQLKGYEPWKGEIPTRNHGVLVSLETGPTFAYALDKLQDRGKFFIIDPGEDVYAGQILGEHIRSNDLTINLGKAKKLTNMRSAGNDEKNRIAPPKRFSLEEALEYIQEDEYVEVTPKSLRLRKIHLTEEARKKNSKKTTA